MGTRADFYVGIDGKAEWLGSIAWDGYPEGMSKKILLANTPEKFKKAVSALLEDRDDATLPEDGWPWPWDNSGTTDFAYAIHNGEVLSNCFGQGWQTSLTRLLYDKDYAAWDEDLLDEVEKPEETFDYNTNFPDMSDIQNVTLGKRSGVMIISG